MGFDLGIGEAALAATAATAAETAAVGTTAAAGTSALTYASLAAGALGAATSAVGAISSASAQSAAAKYQAQVARNNGIIANQNAEATTQAGQAAATATSLRSRALLGAVTASEGASGVDLNTGSSVEARETQREMGQLDTMTEGSNAALRAYGYRTQSANFDAQAGLDTATARNATTAGAIGAGGSLISGASSLGLKWAQLQNAGAVGG